MRSAWLRLTIALCMALPVWAGVSDDLKFPMSFENLAKRATDSVDVTLDGAMLRLASGFLSQDDPDEARVKKLVAKLKGVYVRTFEFDKDGQYSMADVNQLRDQLKGPQWSQIMSLKSTKGENADIYLKKIGDAVAGLVVIATEPRELTVVHIDGPIDPQELSELGGHMGIPSIGKQGWKKEKKEE